MATEQTGKQSSFEHALEADMTRLATEIQGQRERPGMKDAAEKELLKEAIRAFPSFEKKPQASGSAQTSMAVSDAADASGGMASQSPLPAYAQKAPAEVKLEIEYLLEVTLQQGLSKALSEAKKSPYFVQDAFHDTLAGKLYPELKKRGMIK